MKESKNWPLPRQRSHRPNWIIDQSPDEHLIELVQLNSPFLLADNSFNLSPLPIKLDTVR